MESERPFIMKRAADSDLLLDIILRAQHTEIFHSQLATYLSLKKINEEVAPLITPHPPLEDHQNINTSQLLCLTYQKWLKWIMISSKRLDVCLA